MLIADWGLLMAVALALQNSAQNSAQNTAQDQLLEIGEERAAGLGEEKGRRFQAMMAAAVESLTGPTDRQRRHIMTAKEG